MDVEGCEAELICSLESHVFTTIDFVLEVGSHESALLIYDFLKQKGLSANAQKIGWEKVAHLENMPKSYKDGSLIIPKQKVT